MMNIPRAQNDSVDKNQEQSEFVPKKRVINPPRKQKNGKPPAQLQLPLRPLRNLRFLNHLRQGKRPMELGIHDHLDC
ncbi:hypothetical protein ACHQM5_011716 [Ranunculus cassubicifolius]